jgi:hypothetical protein
VNGETLVGNQITQFSEEDVLFGANLRDLALNPDVAKLCNPVLEGAGEIGHTPGS